MNLPYVLPYVIDNRAHRLADILSDLLHSDAVNALDVATAYFNVGAFDLVQGSLDELASLRLLLGSEPDWRARPASRGRSSTSTTSTTRPTSVWWSASRPRMR